LDDISQAEVDWMRPEPILWSSIEPRRGERNWGVLAGLEGNLKLAAQTGAEVVAIVTGTPGWAGVVPGSKCGPIKQNELASFARFISDLVSRYSAPPYSVRYWELWNEPDVDPSNSGLSTYGCWGDQDDPYYGGGYYAEMLKAVYPALKAANPQAQVLVGGLLLGCDPRNPDQCAGRDPASGKFLEGILRAGGAAYFDGVSFHAFDGYAGTRGLYGNANWGAAWDTTGPSVLVKARFLREVLAAYSAGDKYLIATEAALTYSRDVCDPDCQLSKAYYMQQIYAGALAEGLNSTLWYCLRCGWRQVDLFDSRGQPLPAYYAYLAAWQALQGARFLREVNLDGKVRIYEFQRGDRTVWAVWALDQGEHHIQLPSRPVEAFNVLGAAIPVAESSLTVTLEPVYLEW
jgi:hypothetical protein